MSDFANVEAIRKSLETLCRMPNGRTNWPEIDLANNWRPYEVIDAASLSRFTDQGAWEFIADCFRDGIPIQYKPPSADYPDHAYVLIAAPREGGRQIYMKVAVRPGVKKLVGISFHYERHT